MSKEIRDILNKIASDAWLKGVTGGANIDQALLSIKKIVEGEIWNILIISHGCKPNKEDCSGNKCLRFYKCEAIATDIAKLFEVGK